MPFRRRLALPSITIANALSDDFPQDSRYETRAFIDEPGIELNERCAGVQFFDGVGRGMNASDSNDRDLPAAALCKVADDFRRTRSQWTSAQSTSTDLRHEFSRRLQAVSSDRRVRCHDACNACRANDADDVIELAIGQVRRDLQKDRTWRHEAGVASLKVSQQPLEWYAILQ